MLCVEEELYHVFTRIPAVFLATAQMNQL